MLIIGLVIGFAIFSSPSSFSGTDPWIPWVYLVLLLVIIADMKFGIYATVDDGVFYEVKHFIFQRSIKITDIGKVIYQPTWVIGQKMRLF